MTTAKSTNLEPGNKVLTFAIVTVGVLPDNLDIEEFDNYAYQPDLPRR